MSLNLQTPGVYVEELAPAGHHIQGVPTSVCAFIGRVADPSAPRNQAVRLSRWADYVERFGGLTRGLSLPRAVYDFFQNGGTTAVVVAVGRTHAAVTTACWPSDGRVPALVARADAEGDITVSCDVQGSGVSTQLTLEVRHTPSATEASPKPKTRSLPKVSAPWPEPPDHTSVSAAVDGLRAQMSGLLVELSDDPTELVEHLVGKTKPRNATMLKLGTLADSEQSAHSDLGAVPLAADLCGSEDAGTGLHALDAVDDIGLVCIPIDGDENDWWAHTYTPAVHTAVHSWCQQRHAFLILDAPAHWADTIRDGTFTMGVWPYARPTFTHAAVYFPRVEVPDPDRPGHTLPTLACGMVAGTVARTDSARGVWKAPAGLPATLLGATGLSVSMRDSYIDQLHPHGVNCLRVLRGVGTVVWGARTTAGADLLGSPWSQISTRRLASFIESSLLRGTKWAVFEPNDEALWGALRASVGAFMQDLQRQGAFYAHTVSCDGTTTLPIDIERGRVNVVVAFAPVHPAEFVTLYLQQLAPPAG